MPRPYRHLTFDERRTIFRLLNAKVPAAAIAEKLGRHRSTIHREISRNYFHAQRAMIWGAKPRKSLIRRGLPRLS